MNAANGRIVVDRAGATVTAKTANGDIRLGEMASGVIVAHTALGKIDIGIATASPPGSISTPRSAPWSTASTPHRSPDRALTPWKSASRTSFGDITDSAARQRLPRRRARYERHRVQSGNRCGPDIGNTGAGSRDPRAAAWRSRTRSCEVLRGVDFDVARGSIFALLGSNGAGKTTIVQNPLNAARSDAGSSQRQRLRRRDATCGRAGVDQPHRTVRCRRRDPHRTRESRARRAIFGTSRTRARSPMTCSSVSR